MIRHPQQRRPAVIVPRTATPGDLARHLMFVTTPALWPAWPFLPVVRRTNGVQELGVMFDALSTCDVTGYSATVFLTNIYEMPSCLNQLLALQKEIYDTGDEVIQSGWRVD
jgi:hypothetical protein